MNLKEQMVTDLDVFFNTDEFGYSAVFSRSGLTINLGIDTDQDPETSRYVDYVTVKRSDVTGVVSGDTFTIGADVYRVVSSKPEALGELMCMIRVEK